MMNTPQRGFPLSEFQSRHSRASQAMDQDGIDGLLVTSEEHIRYFTGFDTQFWVSPTRPWFVIVPRDNPLIAVIPEIGVNGMELTWVNDIRSWPSPTPKDDGVTLLVETIKEVVGKSGTIGAELGHEMVLRMPILDFQRVRDLLFPLKIRDSTSLLKKLRAIKTSTELEKIKYICKVASNTFQSFPEKINLGNTEREICKQFKLDMLLEGADSVPYVMGVSGQGGYDNIIMGPSDRVLLDGDILIIDTGGKFDGYFCDFDRNFSFGNPTDVVRSAYAAVYEATEIGIETAKPGIKVSDLWSVMTKILDAAGAINNHVGRMGHGLGMQLTEWPSNHPDDNTILVPGMVMTIEPGMEFLPGALMVHEENIVITEDGCELLSVRASPEIIVVD